MWSFDEDVFYHSMHDDCIEIGIQNDTIRAQFCVLIFGLIICYLVEVGKLDYTNLKFPDTNVGSRH